MANSTLDQLRRLTTRSIIFTIAAFLQAGIGFLMIPVYTRYLPTADYGILAIATTVGNVLTILYLQSFEAVYARFYYDFGDEGQRRGFFGTIWPFHLAFACTLTAIIELAGRSTAIPTLIGIPYAPYLRLIVFTTLISTTTILLPRALFLVREHAWKFAALDVALSLLSMVAIIYFVAFRGEGADGSLKGALLATVAVGAPSLVIAVRNLRLSWNLRQIREALAFAVPMVPHLLSLWVLSLSDRIILRQYASLEDVGIYALGYQIGAAVQISAIAISAAFNPFYYRTASSRPDAKEILPKAATYYLVIVAWVAVAITVLAPDLLALIRVRPGYAEASRVVPWVALASFIRGFYFVFVTALFYAKKLGSLPLATVIAAASNVALNLLLIPRYGYMAAAITTIIAYLLHVVLILWFAQRAYPLDYEWRRLGILIVLAAGWAVMTSWLTIPTLPADLVMKTLLVLGFPGVLWVLKFFSTTELRRFREIALRK